MSRRQVMLFISHSSKDEQLVRHLLRAIKSSFEIPDDNIRCTSLPGYQLSGGANIATTLQTEIRGAKAVIGVLTPNSITSPWVLCELGAVWGLVSNFVPIVVGVDPDKLRGPFGAAQVWRLDRVDDLRSSLNQVGRHLQNLAAPRQQSKDEEDSMLSQLVSFSANYKPDTDVVEASELYSLYQGSKYINNDTDVFQDFDVSRFRGTNANAVQSLWADTFTNGNVRALVMSEAQEKYLRIWFDNGIRLEVQGERAKGWASNVAIRPCAALGNTTQEGLLKHNTLRFFARTPAEETKTGHAEDIGLSLRLLDRRLTNWVYTTTPKGKAPTQFRVTNDWQSVRALLSPELYSLYTASGNRLHVKCDKDGEPIPDFTVLAGVTVVLGRYTTGRQEPEEGSGVVDIKEMTLTD